MGGDDVNVPGFMAGGTLEYDAIFSLNSHLLRIDSQVFDESAELSEAMERMKVPADDTERFELACMSHRVLISWEDTARLGVQERCGAGTLRAGIL